MIEYKQTGILPFWMNPGFTMSEPSQQTSAYVPLFAYAVLPYVLNI